MDGSNLSFIPDDRCKSAKNFAWQWTKDLDPVTMHFYCVFCNHKCTGSISRFKHHLGGVSSGGMISCKKVLPNVKEECFANVMRTKEKRKVSHELCHGGGEDSENVDMGTTRTPYVSSRSGSVSTTHSQQISSFLPPRSRGPLDKYNGDLLYDYLDDVIQQIGEENVVQVIYDNASNYKNAKAKLMERKENSIVNIFLSLTLKLLTLLIFFLAAWWERFGHKTPELTKFAIRIHTKIRNRLEHKRLNALAYVKYNLALQQRSKKMREKYDPIVVEEIASYDEWITEIEDLVLPEDPTWLEDELLYNVEVVRNVPPPVYEGGSYIREPRVFSSSSSS
ncbi:unnamed protein product [Malus baccata var. baccata]